MEAALIIVAALVGVGAILYVHHRLCGTKSSATPPGGEEMPAQAHTPSDDGCCGLHATCERDSLIDAVSPEIEYFDDEELDRFAGRRPESYDDDEIEEFREVLLSMPADNIAPWARSISLRGISLPGCIADELLLIVSEARAKRSGKPKV